MEHTDLAIIGAGVHGLVTAKTFLEVNPTAKIVILDQAQTVGGTWAKERLYPGLKTNNMLGTYEFSDFPMTEERFGVKPGQHIPGPVVHEYLRQYAETFDLISRIRLNCKVTTAEMKEEGGWLLTFHSNTSPDEMPLQADRLVVATGLTSNPFIPQFEGSSDFGAPLFHIKELHKRAESLEAAKNVVVFGTSKSAFDACYLYATKGAQVHWIIRSSGHGPVWNAPPYVTPFKIWTEKLVSINACRVG
jgi:cation diffusion facilitator CzcD-associated flavoprotein CzcO